MNKYLVLTLVLSLYTLTSLQETEAQLLPALRMGVMRAAAPRAVLRTNFMKRNFSQNINKNWFHNSWFTPHRLGLGSGAAVLAGLGIYKFYGFKNACPAEVQSSEASDASELKSRCEPEKDSCQYYECREAERPCGPSSYTMNVGHKYCQAFLNGHSGHFSEQGKTWLSAVRHCLQLKMTELPVDMSCTEFSRRSYQSHYDCYIQTNFCQLPVGDKRKLIGFLGIDAFNPKFLSQGLKILGHCWF